MNGKIYAKKKLKERKIYYCAHMDRYIYQHYAHILGLKYNEYMLKNNIDKCSGAYRIERGKCNIDYSYDAFEFIKNKKNATIIIGDFTNFFDNLDHNKLKKRIEIILDSKIDDNMYKVLKSIMKFKYIKLEDLYDYFTQKNKKRSEKYFIRKLERIMDIDEFKEFIKKKNTKNGEPYLRQNKEKYGIVQGSPMSGLLANIYMIEFDKKMNNIAKENRGMYLRYSDDFILVLENFEPKKTKTLYNEIQTIVNQAGQITLEPKKTNIYKYNESEVKCVNKIIIDTENVPDIINFLGFSFDGKKITIRSKTVTKYIYKMDRKIKKYIKGDNKITLKTIYNKFSTQGENIVNKKGNKGNFITYVKRASNVFKNEEEIQKIRQNSKMKISQKIGKLKRKKNQNKKTQ